MSDLTLQRVDRTGAAVDGGLTLWSNARLGFSWSGDPKPGDSFTIGLGDSFSALGRAQEARAHPDPPVEPKLAHTGIAAGGALIAAGALIGAGLLIRNRRNH